MCLQLAVQQQLVHAEHPIHRGANLVAHGGEEFTFGLIGSFRKLLGMQQVCSAAHHLFFQMVALLGEARFAVFNLGQHGVEAAGLHVQLRDATDLGALAVVCATSHTFHKLAQGCQWLDHGGAHAAHQQPAAPQTQGDGQYSPQQAPQRLLVSRSQTGVNHQPACGFVLIHHRRAGDKMVDLQHLRLQSECGCRETGAGKTGQWGAVIEVQGSAAQVRQEVH